jgi:hypothetical protein
MAVAAKPDDAYTSALSTFRNQQTPAAAQPVTSRTNQTLNSLSNLANATPYQFTSAQPFSYNKDTDPAYQAALSSARSNIAQGQADTNAKLRASGQGKSSYSESVANQISAKEMGRVSTDVLPQLIEQAYSRYADQSNRDLQTQQLNYGAQQNQLASLANLYGLQNQQDFQNPLAESQVTGKYLSGDASNAIQQLLGLKQTAESGSNGASYTGQGDALRGYLQSLGIDISGLGADISYADAVKNAANLGSNTLAQRSANMDYANALSQLTGQLYQPKDSATQLYGQTPAGQTLAGQQFQYGQEQDAIGNQINQDQLALQRQQAMANIANGYADNTRQNSALDLQREQFAWSQDPNNPDNLYRVAQIEAARTPTSSTPSASSYKTNPEYAADVQALRADPKQQQLLNTNPQAFISEYGYDGYLALRKEFGLDKTSTDIDSQMNDLLKKQKSGGE